MIKRKATIDDGCNPELVIGAEFDGFFEIPIIKKPTEIRIPSKIIPFSMRHKDPDKKAAIAFYENDPMFADVLIHPEAYIEEFRDCYCIITPDCSLYREAPLAVQVINIYRSHAIGHYYQARGSYVIPQVRWGGPETYTTEVFREKAAFLGVERNGIVAIGSYGCIKTREDKFHFRSGLTSMLKTLSPHTVLVYGCMPNSVFGDYLSLTRFVRYDDWTTMKHGGSQ